MLERIDDRPAHIQCKQQSDCDAPEPRQNQMAYRAARLLHKFIVERCVRQHDRSEHFARLAFNRYDDLLDARRVFLADLDKCAHAPILERRPDFITRILSKTFADL